MIVAYRRWDENEKTKFQDKSIRCIDCHKEDDTTIVLCSENGQRIKAGLIKCGECNKVIKVS